MMASSRQLKGCFCLFSLYGRSVYESQGSWVRRSRPTCSPASYLLLAIYRRSPYAARPPLPRAKSQLGFGMSERAHRFFCSLETLARRSLQDRGEVPPLLLRTAREITTDGSPRGRRKWMQVLGDLGGSRRAHVLLASPVEMRYLTPSSPSFLFLCTVTSLDRASYFAAAGWRACSLHAPSITVLSHLLVASHLSSCFSTFVSVPRKASLRVQRDNWLAT